MRRPLLALSVLVFVVVSTVAGAAAPAAAHAEIRESDPERDGTAPTGTEELSMTFIAFDPEGPVTIDVRDPDGEDLVVGDPEVSARDSTVTVPVEPLDQGVHTVEWSVLSDDGDGRTTGSFQFVAEPPTGSGPGIWLVWAVALAIPAFVFLRPGARKKSS